MSSPSPCHRLLYGLGPCIPTRARSEYHRCAQVENKSRAGGGQARKGEGGEVTKSGFLARFPREGEVWPALCASAGRGRAPRLGPAGPAGPRPGRPTPGPALAVGAAAGGHTMALSRASALQGPAASCPRIAAQTVPGPTAFGHALRRSVAKLCRETSKATSSLGIADAAMLSCIVFLSPLEGRAVISHLGEGTNSPSSLCNAGDRWGFLAPGRHKRLQSDLSPAPSAIYS